MTGVFAIWGSIFLATLLSIAGIYALYMFCLVAIGAAHDCYVVWSDYATEKFKNSSANEDLAMTKFVRQITGIRG